MTKQLTEKLIKDYQDLLDNCPTMLNQFGLSTEIVEHRIAIMRAYVDGEKIESDDVIIDGQWSAHSNPDWHWADHNYRVKKVKPFDHARRPSYCGKVVRYKGTYRAQLVVAEGFSGETGDSIVLSNSDVIYPDETHLWEVLTDDGWVDMY